MRVAQRIRELVNATLRPLGYEVVPRASLYDWQRSGHTGPAFRRGQLPAEAADYLRPDNPRLIELQMKYATLDSRATEPLVWKSGYVRPEDILNFRGDNAYVWQLRGQNMHPAGYALSAYYLQSIDELNLLSRLTEDEFFGIFTFSVNGRVVSRDLLDSITEIYFLEKHLNVSEWENLSCLDIGAGYGRLAHRLTTALPNLATYLCTDAVAVSTFLCEYYLRFRGADRASIIPLCDLERTIDDQPVDIAINVHSFSECKPAAIDWWLSLLERHAVRYLMIVPNSLDHGGTQLLTNNGCNFSPIVERHGYRLVAKDPKYRDPVVQEYGIAPTYHYLFERTQSQNRSIAS